MLAGIQNKHCVRFLLQSCRAISYHPGRSRRFPDLEWKNQRSQRERKGHTSWLPAQKPKTFELPIPILRMKSNTALKTVLQPAKKPKLFIAGLRDAIIKPELMLEACALSAEPKQMRTVDASHDTGRTKGNKRGQPDYLEKFGIRIIIC